MGANRDTALLPLLGWIMRGDVGDIPPEMCRTLDRELVKKHRLASLAHDLGIAGYRDDFIHNALASELWKQLLEEVLAAFDAAGIAACRLKGCAYFLDLYKDIAHRQMGDLDILVRREQFDDASAVLRGLGFATRTTKDFVFAPSHHALTFDRGKGTVDLHRNMMQEGRSRIDLAGIWQRAHLEDHRLDDVDEIVLHICHIVRSELMVPLISFVDLALLLKRSTASRATILGRCDEFRVGRGARIVLATHDLLARGQGGRGAPYPLPSAEELVHTHHLSRPRQLLAKARLIEGPRELAGLALTTLRERTRHWQ